MIRNPLPVFAAAFATLLAAAAPAQAASSYDACTGFIASLPATISTQGVWCLDKDLATSLTSGVAIDIAANNVTIDCNGFKVGGLAAGAGTTTIAVSTSASNATVRNCNIRGFYAGTQLGLLDSSGLRVEGNRFEGMTYMGIGVAGTGGLIRDNLVVDTGGSTATTSTPVGIAAVGAVDVIGNQVAGVDGASAVNLSGIGIELAFAAGSVVEGNRISGISYPEGGAATGVWADGPGPVDIRNNSFVNAQPGVSVFCTGAQTLFRNALMMGPAVDCRDGGGNYPAAPAPL